MRSLPARMCHQSRTFMMLWLLMERGWMWKVPDGVGSHRWSRSITTGAPTAIVAIGHIRIAVGIGHRTIPGVGPRSITADGSGTVIWVGVGLPITFGDPRGY